LFQLFKIDATRSRIRSTLVKGVERLNIQLPVGTCEKLSASTFQSDPGSL